MIGEDLKKNGFWQRVKPSTTLATDVLIEKEEQNGKEKKEMEQVPNPAALDHLSNPMDHTRFLF